MKNRNQVETIKARLNDCDTDYERCFTVKMFMADDMYDPANVRIAVDECGLDIETLFTPTNLFN